MEAAVSTFLRIAGICAVAGPLIVLGADVVHNLAGHDFEWSIALWVGLGLLIPGLIGFAFALRAAGSRLAIAGGAIAFIGALAGASMQVLFRVHAVLTEQGNLAAVDQLRHTLKLVASTQMIGVTFPLGLLMLALSLWMVDRSKWVAVVLLIMGAIAFPLGRIGDVQIAVILSGVLLSAAFAIIGSQVMRVDWIKRERYNG